MIRFSYYKRIINKTDFMKFLLRTGIAKIKRIDFYCQHKFKIGLQSVINV
jgi:hypothetical protein